MQVYFISPPSLNLIGLLTTEIYYWTEKTIGNADTNSETETDTLPIYHIGCSYKESWEWLYLHSVCVWCVCVRVCV